MAKETRTETLGKGYVKRENLDSSLPLERVTLKMKIICSACGTDNTYHHNIKVTRGTTVTWDVPVPCRRNLCEKILSFMGIKKY